MYDDDVREAIMCERCIVRYDRDYGTITVSVPTGHGEEVELGSFSIAEPNEPDFLQEIDEDEDFLDFVCEPETMRLLMEEEQ